MKILSSIAPKVKQDATNDVPQQVDTERLALALSAALRILRNDPTITVTVTRPAEGAQ